MISIDDLLRDEALDIHFQPIISLKQQAIVGLEALARPYYQNVAAVFSQAAREGKLLELDRLCRRKALENYTKLVLPKNPRPLLFLNFEASIVDNGVVGSKVIINSVESMGLSPKDIVIEINESKVADISALIRFVTQYRELGFLIALDDLGSEYSNLSRIIQLRPNIIKVDRGLISEIDHDFFKRQTMKSLVNLSRNIGSLVLAEGVENLAEVDTCALFGVEFFQGFYFARPTAPNNLDLTNLNPALNIAAGRMRERLVNSIRARRLESKRLRNLADQCTKLILNSNQSDFESVLNQFIQDAQDIEAIYLLDQNGLQVTDTYLSPGIELSHNRLFSPAIRGADHSNKDYFFILLNTKLDRYTTDSYLSLATGNSCRTIAVKLNHPNGQKYVLCIDLSLKNNPG